MATVDLKSVAAPVTGKTTTVVSFKEARKDNVILSSGGIYIYTMRAAPTELRVVNVAAPNARESFKLHTSVPTVAKITSVGIKQHMVASGSDAELFIWATQGQSITTFFKWSDVKINAIEWVKGPDSSSPALIVMYTPKGGAKKLGVISTKKIMERYTKSGLDSKTVEITAEDVHEPALSVADCNLLAAGTFGESKGIAVASTTKSVVNVVFSDNSTAKVALPDGENVSSVFINDDFFLVVAGAKGSVVVYNLRNKESEPKSVLQAKLPSAPTSSASLGNLVSFAVEGAVYTLQIATDGAKAKAVTITEAVQSFAIVEDNGAFRGAFDTEKFLITGVIFDKNSVVIPMTATAAASPASVAASAARPVAAVSLKNNTLASAAAPASIAAAQSLASNEVDAAIEDLKAQMATTQDAIATYGNKTQKMDLEMVVQHALEAQVSELLKLRLPVTAVAGASSGAVTADLDEAFLANFRANLVNNISAGITTAIDQVAESVVAKIRESGKKGAKKAGSDALKRRLDEFVGEANVTFASALSDRMKQGEANFKHSVAHLNRANDEAVRILQQQVDDLNAQLRAVASSGIIEEVKRLRKEVAQLKVRASAGGAAPVSPDTLIQTAIATIDAGNVEGGFEYAAATNNSTVVASVLVGVKNVAFEATTLPNALWSSVLTLGAIGAQTKEEAVAVLNASEVVKDDDSILSVNAGKARVALKAFAAKWKASFASEAPLRNQLKGLEMELGSK